MAPEQPSPTALLKQISTLESSLLADLSNPNNLLPLLSLARHNSPEVVHKAIWALHRAFIPLISSGRVGGIVSTSLVSRGADASEEEVEVGSGREVKIWVRERLVEYLEILGGLLRDSEAALRVCPSIDESERY
jgi:U3 small nucleolar RNA-associated protein 19